MPRLARLRLISIGNIEARFEDLTLDFCDGAGTPDDAIIWLRNAGGKSTLLRLLFSMILPERRQFIAEVGQRKLKIEDYLAPGDCGVVVAEWEKEGDALLLDGIAVPGRYLTGVFREQPRVGVTNANAETYFFATKVRPEEPRLTLEGLPLIVERDGQRIRRPLVGFKQEWQDLGKRYGASEVKEANAFHAWAKILNSADIDPGLFEYQIEMNRQEGGAHELFKFSEVDDFVDFFLNMVLEPDAGERVALALQKYRSQVMDRETLMVERDLVSSLLELAPRFQNIARDRAASLVSGTDLNLELSRIEPHTQDRITQENTSRAEAEAVHVAAKNRAAEAGAEAKARRHRATTLRYYAAEKRAREQEISEAQVRTELASANRAVQIWTAAVPLRDALYHKALADDHSQRLEQASVDHPVEFDALVKAAESYAAALSAAAAELRALEADAAADGAEARRNAAGALASAVGHENAANVLLNRAGDLDARLEQVLRTRSALADVGALDPAEAVSDALARWGDTVAKGEARLANALDDVSAAAEKVEANRASHQRVETSRATSMVKLAALLSEYDHGVEEKSAIESTHLLVRCLDREEIDLEQLDSADVHFRLRETESAAMDKVLDLRAQHAENVRAISSLTDTELLPPERDVERLCSRLDSEGFRAWTGWHYLSHSIPQDQFRSVIVRSPEVARGVVVPDDEFEDARTFLEGADLRLEQPIVVARQSHELGHTQDDRVVVGPSSDAQFDRRAAQAELTVREVRHRHQQVLLKSAETEAAGIGEVIAALGHFRRQYPSGWFQTQSIAIQQQRESAAQLADEDAALAREADTLAREASEAEDRVVVIRNELATAREHLVRLTAFAGTHPDEPAVIERLLRQAHWEAQAESDAALRQRERIPIEEEKEQTNAAAAKAAGEAARVQEAHLAAVNYLEGCRIEPRAGDTALLSARFRDLESDFHKRADTTTLRALYSGAKANEQDARTRFLRELEGSHVSEEEVLTALSSLTNPGTVSDRARDARDAAITLAATHGAIAGGLTSAKGEARRLMDAATKFGGLLPALKAEGEAENALELADQEDGQAHELEELSRQKQDLAREAQERAGDADRRRELLIRHQKAVAELKDRYSRVLAPVPPQGSTMNRWSIPDDGDIEARIESISGSLRAALSTMESLDRQAASAAEAIRKCVDQPQFDKLRLESMRRLKGYSPEALEAESQMIVEDLTTRVTVINSELKELDTHRTVIIGNLASIAGSGITMLTSAGRVKMPESLKNLAQRKALEIKITEASHPAEAHERIGRLIDGWISSGKIPQGNKIIHQVVKCLAKPIQVRVLFPDPDGRRGYISVDEFYRLSGGERITCAVMLFAILAQQRAWRRGISANPSAVLILDNPIGGSSRPKFLRLQREVARAMGVQLIYATGVNDPEALRVFPVIVRLRNDRYDRRTGRRWVELAESNPPIDRAKMVFPDQIARPSPDQKGTMSDATSITPT